MPPGHTAPAGKVGRDLEDTFSKVGNTIRGLTSQFLGLFGIIVSVRAMEKLFTDITKTNTATGYLSQTLGEGVKNLTEFQKMAERLGGSAEGVATGINSIQQALSEVKDYGPNQIVPLLRERLGIDTQTEDGGVKSATDLIREIHTAIQRELKAGNMTGPDCATVHEQARRASTRADDDAVRGGI